MPVFLAWLTFKATEHAKAYPDKLTLEDVQGVKTFAEFDSRVTLPVFGFSSPEVYPAPPPRPHPRPLSRPFPPHNTLKWFVFALVQQ